MIQSLVADRLGAERAEELFCDVHVRAFSSYLFRHAGSTPPKSTYKPRVYSNRGGVEYFRPDGWVQLWVTAGGDGIDFADLEAWPVAYHGTDSTHLASILEAGLRKPGELPSVQMRHGAAGAGPDGAVYVSPSLFLASHPVYSTFLQLGPCHWAQFVFKVRVRPGSYRIQRSTFSSSRHWAPDVQLDPNFEHNEALEWVISDSCDVMIVGLMVRELGEVADPEVFGEVATEVSANPCMDADYAWTRLLEQSLRCGGFMIDNGHLSRGNMSVEWHFGSVPRLREIYRPGQAVVSSEFDLAGAGVRGGQLILHPSGGEGPVDNPVLTLKFGRHLTLWYEICIDTWSCSAAVTMADYNDHILPLEVFSLDESVSICIRVISAEIPYNSKRTGNAVTWSIDANLFPLWEARRRLCIWSGPFCLSAPAGTIALWISVRAPHDGDPSEWADYCIADILLDPSGTTVPGSATVSYRLGIADKSVRFVKRVADMGSARVWLPLSRAVRGGRMAVVFRLLGAG